MVRTNRQSVVSACLLTALAAGQASAQHIKMLPPPSRPQPQWVVPLEPRIVENGPVVVCFAEGTSPLYAAAITELTNAYNQQFATGPNDFFTLGSLSGTQGTPRAVTWSFVPDGTLAPGLSGQPSAASNLFATMDPVFASQGGATWTSRFAQSFARWQQLSGLTYTRVTVGGNDWDDGAAWGSTGSPGLRGDVRIAMRSLDGFSNVLAFNQYPPPNGNSDMVLDSGDANGNFNSSTNANRFLRNVVMHEHGHGMGVQHVCSQNATFLMEPFIDTSFDGPRQDDMRAAQYNYGDPFESNDTFATARAIGALASGSPINSLPVPAPLTGASDPTSSIYSIDNFNKVDWFSFTIAAATSATFTITPIGSTYDNSQQQGSCPGTVNNINTLAIGNLAVEVYASNGTSLIAAGNSAASGLVETLSGVSLGTPGTYYMKVLCSDFPNGPQMYRFNITASSPCPSFTLHPESNDYCEGANIVLTVNAIGAPVPTYQWRKNGQPILGAGSTTLFLLGADPLNTSGVYDCVATNSCTSVISNPATIRVTNTPEITGQPGNQQVPAGATASFTVTSPTLQPLSYAWRHNGNPLPGENNPTLTITNVGPANEGTYRCFLTNLCGNLFSDIATLTIQTTNPCYANCDGSSVAPILNVNDFTCFINEYAAASSYANCDGSTTVPILNVNDFTCFINQYAAGCP